MNLLLSLHCFFFISLFLAVSNSFALKSLCSDDESNALLHFKQSFVINKEASSDPQAYPKVESWHHEKDCCLWDGVECDEYTGHVVGIDLHSSCLYGSISSNSSLFKLVHLRSLNLADNDFNDSKIPSQMHHLSSLNYLNLSMSVFSGQPQILKRLVQNLTRLEVLDLSYVNISSAVSDIFANVASSLRSLVLVNCGLIGSFPAEIILLPNLEFLRLEQNQNLNGHLPEFPSNTPLKILRLGETSFSGTLSESIGKLSYLTEFNIRYCNFSGLIPSSLGSLSKLTYLSFKGNNFMGDIPSSLENLKELTLLSFSSNNLTLGNLAWVGSLTNLNFLGLSGTNLGGEIPSSIQNLTKLQILSLEHNQLVGQIPVWLSNLTQLTFVTLQYNNLQGPIPESIFQLANLESLYLNYNQLNGTVNLNNFLNLTNLNTLDLTSNGLSVLVEGNKNDTLPRFKWLGLARCNLRTFPNFLQYQNDLVFLELDQNSITGPVPNFIWNISTLGFLSMSSNALTGSVPSVMISQLKNLKLLHIFDNQLQGPHPGIPSSLVSYHIGQNLFSGNISPLICQAKSLEILKLDGNRLSGKLPDCLGNFTDSLLLIDLTNNFLQGSIPDTFVKGNGLRMLNLRDNQFEGNLPRSLVNCEELEGLDVSNNRINDTFPYWLGILPNLQVLSLRENKLNGGIENSPIDSDFSMLRILDLSYNNIEGNLSHGYFHTWNNMISLVQNDKLEYMEFNSEFDLPGYSFSFPYYFGIRLSKSGVNIVYTKISEIVVAIDLSSNTFTGEILESLGSLQELIFLNLSNNGFTGQIPSSFENLTSLNSLDLSNNNLTGQIPPSLIQITPLGFLNVSHNNLSGHIPTGKQFDTFENSSYIGNFGLCGKPLSKTCGPSPPPQSPSPPITFEEDDDSTSFFGYNKIVILMGYIGGLIVGVVIGQFFTDWKHEWFVKISARRQQRKRRG